LVLARHLRPPLYARALAIHVSLAPHSLCGGEKRLIHALRSLFLFLADVEQQLKNVVDKLVAQIAKLAHEEMPPLTYQLLLLANKVRGRRTLFASMCLVLWFYFRKG